MEISIKQMQSDLDFYYKVDFEKYSQKLSTIKSMGYKVYRNVNGEHIIKRNENFIYEAFGGVFKKIFKKGEN